MDTTAKIFYTANGKRFTTENKEFRKILNRVFRTITEFERLCGRQNELLSMELLEYATLMAAYSFAIKHQTAVCTRLFPEDDAGEWGEGFATMFLSSFPKGFKLQTSTEVSQ